MPNNIRDKRKTKRNRDIVSTAALVPKEEYAFVVHNGERAYVLVPVDDYEAMIKKGMALEAITQIQEGDGELISADDFALELAAESIADARKKAGLTQKQLGEKLGIPQSQVSRIERRPDRTTVRTMRRLAKALGVDVAVFLRFGSRAGSSLDQ